MSILSYLCVCFIHQAMTWSVEGSRPMQGLWEKKLRQLSKQYEKENMLSMLLK